MALKTKGLFVIGAKRTPFCNYGGPLKEVTASHIFAAAAKDAIDSANIKSDIIDSTVVGNINFLSQCDGGKTPRYCGSYSGVPIERPALGVNKACGTGLQAVVSGGMDILTGSAKVCLVGGTELMSSLPMLVRNVRFGTILGAKYQMEDHIKRQLVDSFCGLGMDEIAENLAKRYKFSREAVDRYALESHLKCTSAAEQTIFEDEITPVLNSDNEEIVAKDDIPQTDLTLSELAALPLALNGGSVVTSGNSSVPADGAAALILANEESVNNHQLTPLARLTAWATVGVNPTEAGLGAVLAVQKLLAATEKKIQDVDLFEINETFASQAMAIIEELKVESNKVNISGGALSIGHPVAATGARMATHLAHRIRRNKARIAVAASSCGGGQGIAIMLESA
ncbi:unnamed protein product, partial [Iphiclides podalirius]